MITVADLSGNEEGLNHVQGFEMDEEANGNFQVSFSTVQNENNPGYDLLDGESVVQLEGYGFRVKQFAHKGKRKEVVALSTFFDLTGHRQEEIYGGTHTFNEFATFTFKGSGWAFINQDVTGSALIPNFGADNVIKLVQAMCAAFNCEYKILPNNTVLFAKQIGPDNDAQYRYKHNIKTLSKSVDTTNLRIKIKGYGANGLVVTYTSPNASKFPHAGEAEPIKDDRYTIASSLLERIKGELIDYPEVAYELDVVELLDKELGERVWLIHEPMGIEFQTRILSKKSVFRGGKLVTKSVVLGNSKPRTLSDILTSQKVEIDENKQQSQSWFEQTNDRISMGVERLEGDITQARAEFEITANSITSRVEEVKTESFTNAEEQAAAALTNARSYTDNLLVTVNTRITDAESSITQLADSITSKVDAKIYETGIADAKQYAELKASGALGDAKTYTDNEVAPVITRITDAESSITQLSNSIESRVTESVSVLEGEIDDLQGDVSGLGTRIYNAESTITQHAGQISSKVEQTDFNGNTIVSKINQTATTFSIDAKNIDLNGITNVADEINLGTVFNDGVSKAINFRGLAGGARIFSSKTDLLEIFAMNGLTLSSYGSVIIDAPIIGFKDGARIDGLNLTAKFG